MPCSRLTVPVAVPATHFRGAGSRRLGWDIGARRFVGRGRVALALVVPLICCTASAQSKLAEWGDNSLGQCDVPIVPWGTFLDISSGRAMCVSRLSSGSVIAWGDNSHGQCNVPTGLNFVEVANKGSHTLARRSDGFVVASGDTSIWRMQLVRVACGSYLRRDRERPRPFARTRICPAEQRDIVERPRVHGRKLKLRSTAHANDSHSLIRTVLPTTPR